MNQLQSKLVETLHSIACYNDKGYEWMGHTSVQSDKERSDARQEISRLIAAIGEPAFDPSLLQMLKSTEAVMDFSGRYAEETKRWFTFGSLRD
jgi:hypothetical protein